MSSTDEYQQRRFYLPHDKVVTTKKAKDRLTSIEKHFGRIPLFTVKELEEREFSTNFKRNK